MNQTTLDFVQAFRTQMDKLEDARLRLAERATIPAQPDAALAAACNAFMILEDFLQGPEVMEQQRRSGNGSG